MKQSLSNYLSELSRAFVVSAREATKEAVRLAQNADALKVECPIAGLNLEVEGAANLPKTIMMMKAAELDTEAFIDLDVKGRPQVTLKRGLFGTASRIKVRMEFERSQPLESMELVRDRAVEVLKDGMQTHRVAVAITGSGATIEALELALADLKKKQAEENDDGSTHQ